MNLSPAAVYVDGDLPSIKDFQLPEITPLVFGPPLLHGWIRRHLVQRPVNIKNLCKDCGDCRRYCPAAAIDQEGKRITFDYDRCIRCYCCIEVCPHGALKAKETLIGKIMRRMINIIH
jgi:ferredoxin